MNGEHLPVFDQLEDDLLHAGHAITGWFEPHHHTSTAPAAAAVTIETTTQEDHHMSTLSDQLHAAAGRLEKFDDDALTKLEQVQGNPVTAEAFNVVAGLTGINPSPEFSAVLTLMKAFAPQQPAAAPDTTAAAGPLVAGQA